MNTSHIIQAMLRLNYESPISVELDTLEIWLGDEENKKTLTKAEIEKIKIEAEKLI
jgi:hypothetical protein